MPVVFTGEIKKLRNYTNFMQHYLEYRKKLYTVIHF